MDYNTITIINIIKKPNFYWLILTNQYINFQFIFIGINNDWELTSFYLKFEYLGGKHTGAAIKDHYDRIVREYDIEKKIYRVITDQGKNYI